MKSIILTVAIIGLFIAGVMNANAVQAETDKAMYIETVPEPLPMACSAADMDRYCCPAFKECRKHKEVNKCAAAFDGCCAAQCDGKCKYSSKQC